MSKRENESFLKSGVAVIMSIMVMYTAACAVSFVWYCYEFTRIGFTWGQVPNLLFASYAYAFLFNQFWNVDLIAMLPVGALLGGLHSKGISFSFGIWHLIIVLSLCFIIFTIYFVDTFLFLFLHEYQRYYYSLFVIRLFLAGSIALIFLYLSGKSDAIDKSR